MEGYYFFRQCQKSNSRLLRQKKTAQVEEGVEKISEEDLEGVAGGTRYEADADYMPV